MTAKHPHFVIRILLIFTVLAALATSFLQGVEKNYDARITYGFENDSWQMSIALSRLLFDLHEGYMGYRHVANALASVLAPDGLHNTSSIALVQDADAINAALKHVAQLDPKTFPPYRDGDGWFVSAYAEDVGLADFYTLAFSIFGLQAHAMYRFYFLVLGLGALLYAVAYRRQTGALALLALICSSFAVFFFSDVFSTPGMPSVNSNRFGTTLGVIPILHLLVFFRQREKPGRATLALLVGQGLLFAFAMSLRNTARWELLLALAVIGVMVWQRWPHEKTLVFKEKLRALFHHAAMQGAAVFLLAYSLYGMVQYTQLNTVYRSDCAQPYHMTWHSMMLGLTVHPEWEKYHSEISSGPRGDAIAWMAFEEYMKARGEAFTCPETGGLYKVKKHERVIRSLFLQFALRHPSYMFELQAIHKPQQIFQHLTAMLKGVEKNFWLAMLAGSVAAGLAAAFLTQRAPRRLPWKLLAIAALGLVLSALPNWFAYPNRIMVDLLWMLVINGCLWVWAVVYRFCPRFSIGGV